MKDFLRQEPLFSLCGLNCGLCTMHLGGHCPGCGGGAGNQSCSLARCSLQHGGVACHHEVQVVALIRGDAGLPGPRLVSGTEAAVPLQLL